MRRRYLNKQWDISTAIIDGRISVEPEDAGTANGSTGQRCAVVYNPIKISEELRDAISQQAATQGWAEPVWLETSADEPRRPTTDDLMSAHVDRVIAVGGDGTIRMVADRLAGSGLPMAVVPVGTGNLLARNLDIPLTEEEAIEVACGYHTRDIDLIKVTADGVPGEHFAVIGGLGVDAMIMEETDPQLKDVIGAGAYFVAAAKALGRTPIEMRIAVDDYRPHRRRAMICAIGNVGTLAGNLTLLPDARPDDGRLDVYVASPHRLTHWIRVFLRLITRRPRGVDHVDVWQGRRVEVRLKHRDPYELDGDVVGDCLSLSAEVQPGALTVHVPG
ncbi:MAG: diacylglycerol kinase family protein [Propionibacteriaceae bacterium]